MSIPTWNRNISLHCCTNNARTKVSTIHWYKTLLHLLAFVVLLPRKPSVDFFFFVRTWMGPVENWLLLVFLRQEWLRASRHVVDGSARVGFGDFYWKSRRTLIRRELLAPAPLARAGTAFGDLIPRHIWKLDGTREKIQSRITIWSS